MRTWLMLGVFIVGCGGATGKPLHAFPSRAELAKLGAEPEAQRPLALDQAELEDWTLSPSAHTAAPSPLRSVLANATPKAALSPALECVAQELARVLARTHGKHPTLSLRRYIAARCGALLAMPAYNFWSLTVPSTTTDEELIARFKTQLTGAVAANAEQAGAGFFRDGDVARLVITYGTPDVELPGFDPVVDANGVLVIHGSVRFDASAVVGYINVGEHGVKPCVLDPAVVAPEFTLRCELGPNDDYAAVDVLAMRRGRVLAQQVLNTLALRTRDVALSYRARHVGAAHPVTDATQFQNAVLRLVNHTRSEAQLAPLVLAPKQCQLANPVTPVFFHASLTHQEQNVVDVITLGLMAGWDVTEGTIRNGSLTASLIVDSLDAERWLADVLERPTGRAVLLDADARALALGTLLQRQPSALGAVAMTYAFFETDAQPAALSSQVLERLTRVRAARGLGPTASIQDAPIVQTQLALIKKNQVLPEEALTSIMEHTVQEVHAGVRGFVAETHDLEHLEFPPELLKVRDLKVRLGVTYYRAAGGAWGQYVVVFVVVDPGTVI